MLYLQHPPVISMFIGGKYWPFPVMGGLWHGFNPVIKASYIPSLRALIQRVVFQIVVASGGKIEKIFKELPFPSISSMNDSLWCDEMNVQWCDEIVFKTFILFINEKVFKTVCDVTYEACIAPRCRPQISAWLGWPVREAVSLGHSRAWRPFWNCNPIGKTQQI